VSTGGLSSQYLPARGDLESFRHRFLCFASGNGLRHRARKICVGAAITNIFSWLPPRGDQAALNINRQHPKKLQEEKFKARDSSIKD